MEMLGTSRSIAAARAGAAVRVDDAEIDAACNANFLAGIGYFQFTYLIPLSLIALCSLSLPRLDLMLSLILANALVILMLYSLVVLMRRNPAPDRIARLWRSYEAAALVSGLCWALMMLPVIGSLGRDIQSMFVCLIIIMTVSISCVVTASQQRVPLILLAGFQIGLLPQTMLFMDVIGLIPLVATLSLIPTVILLVRNVRRQTRTLIGTQIEKQRLAERLGDALATAEYLANRDSLTGLYNRRAFETLAEDIRRDSLSAPLAMILIDLDHFKQINDRHGHNVGDLVLKNAAFIISSAIGPMDLIGRGDGALARWGGEEFILLLRNCATDQAGQIAEHIRAALCANDRSEWPLALPAEVQVSGSLGVASWPADLPLHQAIARADTAMYRAKAAGRNRVCDHDAAPHAAEGVSQFG